MKVGAIYYSIHITHISIMGLKLCIRPCFFFEYNAKKVLKESAPKDVLRFLLLSSDHREACCPLLLYSNNLGEIYLNCFYLFMF